MVASIVGFTAIAVIALYATFYTFVLCMAGQFLNGTRWLLPVTAVIAGLLWYAAFSIAPFSITFGG